jgi:excisionase family DNA binding protein
MKMKMKMSEHSTPSEEHQLTPMLTGKEACAYYRISMPTLRNMREQGRIKYIKVGRQYRYRIIEES